MIWTRLVAAAAVAMYYAPNRQPLYGRRVLVFADVYAIDCGSDDIEGGAPRGALIPALPHQRDEAIRGTRHGRGLPRDARDIDMRKTGMKTEDRKSWFQKCRYTK